MEKSTFSWSSSDFISKTRDDPDQAARTDERLSAASANPPSGHPDLIIHIRHSAHPLSVISILRKGLREQQIQIEDELYFSSLTWISGQVNCLIMWRTAVRQLLAPSHQLLARKDWGAAVCEPPCYPSAANFFVSTKKFAVYCWQLLNKRIACSKKN